MQLAADPITIEIAGEAYELRPTLRAATRLARRHGDFATIYKSILADHVSIIADLILEGTGSPDAAAFFTTATEIPALRNQLAQLKLPLLRYVLALAGHDNAEQEPSAPTDKPTSFGEYHAQLFRIGTGWLGWSPEDTWNATPAEILAARSGRTDLIESVLKATFGTATDPAAEHYAPSRLAETIAAGTDPTFDRDGFEGLRAKWGKRNG